MSDRERDVKRALEAIAQQRVVMFQPNGYPVIEMGTPDKEWFHVAAATAHIRGWVEILDSDMPMATLKVEDGSPIQQTTPFKPRVFYRLTEGGWMVLRRSHGWVVATFWISLLTLAATLAGIGVTLALAGKADPPIPSATPPAPPAR
jgi:hypothetical protein